MKNTFTIYTNVYNVSIAFILFSLGFAKLNSLSIILFTLITIVGVFIKCLKFEFKPILYVFTLIYIAYIIGFFVSDNKEMAAKYLEYKLPLLLFPILFSFSNPKIINVKIISWGLLIGIFYFIFKGLLNSLDLYASTKETVYFFNAYLSPDIHPSYMSVYVIFGIIILWLGWKQKWFILQKRLVFSIIFVLVLYSIFLLSLAGLLFLVIVLAIFIYYQFFQRYKWKGFILFCFVFCLGVTTIYFALPLRVQSEFSGAIITVKDAFKKRENYIETRIYPMTGSETRLVMWTLSTKLIQEKPMGYGSGDLDNLFEKEFEKRGQKEFGLQHYNPHNQYLQLSLEIGILFLILFVVFLIHLFQKAFKTKHVLLFFVILSLFFNCLFESMLQRQYGLVFYVLMICLLYNFKPSTQTSP
jgi:O-antigen ligase